VLESELMNLDIEEVRAVALKLAARWRSIHSTE
jgi:hypothetical protein